MKILNRDLDGRVTGLPARFIKHYVFPFLFAHKASASRGNLQNFFDNWYRENGVSDGVTVNPNFYPPAVAAHYAATEMSVIKGIGPEVYNFSNKPDLRILDIGSGAGHWIQFYRNLYPQAEVFAQELSLTCCKELEIKFSPIQVFEGDIATCCLPSCCDIVNAVGVLFHIVDDDRLIRTLERIKALMSSDSILIVGGQFGFTTKDVQFHREDSALNVNKRIRSIFWWKKTCKRLQLKVVKKIKTPLVPWFRSPENNILVIRRA